MVITASKKLRIPVPAHQDVVLPPGPAVKKNRQNICHVTGNEAG